MNKTRNLILSCVILSAIILVLNIIVHIVEYQVKKQDETNYLYKITYKEDYEPGAQTTYYLYLDGNIKVQSTTSCSVKECEPEISKLSDLGFNKDNLKLTYDYLRSLLNGKTEIEIYHSDIYNDDKKISILSYINQEREDMVILEISDYEYKLELAKDNNFHMIYLNNNTIKIANLYYKDYSLSDTEIYTLKFNEKNTNIIKNFILKQYEENETYKNIYYGSFEHKDKILLDSIIQNKESLLTNYEREKTLLYTLSFNGLNCITPSLRIYDDKTFEYHYTYTTDGKTPTPKTGSYDYDLNKLIESAEDETLYNIESSFTLSNKEKTYYYGAQNTSLNEFLTSMNLSTSSFVCSLVHEQ